MANIRIDLEATVVNGQALTFKSPADCSQVTGLIIYYPVGDTTASKVFKFVDAHGVDVGSGTISLFAENVLVKVVLDIDQGKAYVQNADTNAYLEAALAAARSSANAAQNTANTAQALAEAAQAIANGASKIQTGTYEGTDSNSVGQNSIPTSLTFNFPPKLVFIGGKKENSFFSSGWLFPASGIGIVFGNAGSETGDRRTLNVTISGNTVSWLFTGASYQFVYEMNWSDQTYHYVAIG